MFSYLCHIRYYIALEQQRNHPKHPQNYLRLAYMRKPAIGSHAINTCIRVTRITARSQSISLSLIGHAQFALSRRWNRLDAPSDELRHCGSTRLLFGAVSSLLLSEFCSLLNFHVFHHHLKFHWSI